MSISQKTVSPYLIIDQNGQDDSWDGAATTISPNQSVSMPQTTNGTMILAYANLSQQNNQGSLAVTSGGGPPDMLDAPALAQMPEIDMHNWHGNNLNVTNISINKETPIWVAARGPGMPGQTPRDLPDDGSPISLSPMASAAGMASPQYMQLAISSASSKLAIVAIVGGPLDVAGNNGYVIAINAAGNTGPQAASPPAGYYATTKSNHYAFPFNWGSSSVYVANMSPSTSNPVQIAMRKL